MKKNKISSIPPRGQFISRACEGIKGALDVNDQVVDHLIDLGMAASELDADPADFVATLERLQGPMYSQPSTLRELQTYIDRIDTGHVGAKDMGFWLTQCVQGGQERERKEG